MNIWSDRNKRWYDAMIRKGHEPIGCEDYLDIFVTDYNFHNGPGCGKCGWTDCMHCIDIDQIPECK